MGLSSIKNNQSGLFQQSTNSCPTVIRLLPVLSVLGSGGLVRDAFRIDSVCRIVVAVLTIVVLVDVVVDVVVVVQVDIGDLVSRTCT